MSKEESIKEIREEEKEKKKWLKLMEWQADHVLIDSFTDEDVMISQCWCYWRKKCGKDKWFHWQMSHVFEFYLNWLSVEEICSDIAFVAQLEQDKRKRWELVCEKFQEARWNKPYNEEKSQRIQRILDAKDAKVS